MFQPPFSQPSRTEILVIGGGIIGVTAAYYLTKHGSSVTLVEKDDLNAGSTYGNAGLIIPSDSLPVPGPGVLTQGLRWLLDSASPFYLKPTLDPEILRWLWDFQGSCREGAWQQAAPLLTELSERSVPLFEEILESEKIHCGYQREGLLLLYTTDHGFREGQTLVTKLQGLGVEGTALQGRELKDRLPPAGAAVRGGIYFRPDAHLDPAVFTHQLAHRAQRAGLRLISNCEVLDFTVRENRIQSALTTRGEIQAEQVVLAAGAWTAELGKKLDLRLPIQPAKGYSITMGRPESYPELPLLLDEAKIAVTPLGDTLRLAGTLELAGLNHDINHRRVQAILDHAAEYLDVSFQDQPLVEIWRGLRPCTPDGLPVIGRSRQVSNLITAGGHCMLGVSQATATGNLVAQIARGHQPELDVRPLSPDRF